LIIFARTRLDKMVTIATRQQDYLNFFRNKTMRTSTIICNYCIIGWNIEFPYWM